MIRAALLLFLLVSIAVPKAAAHRVGIPVTTIEWNANTEAWEVVHRLSAHDLENYFAGKVDVRTLYDTPEGIAALGAYSKSAFDLSGDGVHLTYVGAELDRDQVWIYYELHTDAHTLVIDSNLLFGSGATSFALVNIKGQGGEVQSLIFSPTDGPKKVRIAH